MEQKLGAGAEEGQRKAEKKRQREGNTLGSSPARLAAASKPLLLHAAHRTRSTESPLLL